jgi:hypothetical protein
VRTFGFGMVPPQELRREGCDFTRDTNRMRVDGATPNGAKYSAALIELARA